MLIWINMLSQGLDMKIQVQRNFGHDGVGPDEGELTNHFPLSFIFATILNVR